MASFCAEVLKDVTSCIIINRLTKWYTYVRNYNDNIRRVQESCNHLDNLKKTIDSQVERDDCNLRKPTHVTNEWLDKVKKLMEEDEECKQLLDKENIKGKDQCCFGHLHCNLCRRYEISKTADEKANEIEGLIKDQPPESRITEPIPRSDLKTVPNEFLKSLESRVKLKKDILDKLINDQVNVVGVFGMGAIGKTTLVKEIANSGARDMFDDNVVMVEISEVPNVKRIQDQIAGQIELKLDKKHSLHQRAEKLYNSIRCKEEGSANKRYKILIILDNIWEKLDLNTVGIPQPSKNSEEFCCKLLLTSREKNVCAVMGAAADENFEVHPLDEKEARQLFRARVGEKGQEEGVEDRILKKCGGLPLSIVLLADALRGQVLSKWEHYATELEKRISSAGMIRGVQRRIYSILETSYKLLESDEKRRFLLLACLFPFGARIPVGDMMRYGIGIGLFQYVNNLTEAMDQAKTWANELKSSSLLLEDDDDIIFSEDDIDDLGLVRIHDVVRASTISLAETGGHKFMVEAFPRWMRKETYENYSAISLMAGTDHSRLRGLKSDKLEILILDGTQPPVFDEIFSQHMTKLKVLALKGMKKCEYRLQISIQESKSSLVTLHLENCELGDIGGIGMLVFLEVLSLRGSTVKELPAEAMRKLSNLRLLDLSYCEISTSGIPADVLGRLSQLEGLYAFDAVKKWANHSSSLQESGGAAEGGCTSSGDEVDESEYYAFDAVKKWANHTSSVQESDGSESSEDAGIDVIIDVSEYNNKYASIDELNKLSYLNVLAMQVALEELPNDGDQFVNKLDEFHVRIVFDGTEQVALDGCFPEWSRIVEVVGLDMRKVMEKKSAKALLMKSEQLVLRYMVGLEHCLVQRQSERVDFSWVGKLFIYESYLKNGHREYGIRWSAFPNLESLFMYDVNIKRMIGHQQSQGGSSGNNINNNNNRMLMLPPKLQRLNLQELRQLEGYVVPIDLLPTTLTFLRVNGCPKLKYIFGKAEHEADNNNTNNAPIDFPSLETLVLMRLEKLESMVEVPNSSTSTASPTALFNTQLKFKALERVTLGGLDSIVMVWDMMPCSKEITDGFRNLKILSIGKQYVRGSGCKNLEMLCPLAIADALVQLKQLFICNCEKMREAIKDDGGLLESDGGSVSSAATQQQQQPLSLFPSLEYLVLEGCPKMERFISSSSAAAAKQGYNDNILRVIEFPSLHSLEIRDCKEMQSFSAGGGSFSAPKLTRFRYDGNFQQQTGDINHFLMTHYQRPQRELVHEISEVQE